MDLVLDTETCLSAIRSKDARFDGCFITAVSSTGIYCRPSCPARTPQARNVAFYPTAAAAQRSGYRACKRCRPDASPGSPEWDIRADVVGRAMRLIHDGVVDRDGVPGLAARLGYSVRQVQRMMLDELGAGPVAIARAQRAQTARMLIENTALSMTDIAFAAGFASLRSFNDTMREVFDVAPTALRQAAAPATPGDITGAPCDSPATRDDGPPSPGTTRTPSFITIELRLPYREPFCPDNVFGHLAATAAPGVEVWHENAYHRTLAIQGRPAVVSLSPAAGHVRAVLRLRDTKDLAPVIARCRRLLDLDADPVAITDHLSADPRISDLVRSHPGRRVPRTVDGIELALRIVLGQQVSTAAARTHTGRLVAALGTRIDTPIPGLTHLFPEASAVAECSPDILAFPESRRRTIRSLAEAFASKAIDVGVGADPDAARQGLIALPGVGPWTVESIAMRALGEPDAFPSSDLGLLQAARRRGVATSARQLDTASGAWKPWRAYVTQYLWADGHHAVNQLPGDAPNTHCRGVEA